MKCINCLYYDEDREYCEAFNLDILPCEANDTTYCEKYDSYYEAEVKP